MCPSRHSKSQFHRLTCLPRAIAAKHLDDKLQRSNLGCTRTRTWTNAIHDTLFYFRGWWKWLNSYRVFRVCWAMKTYFKNTATMRALRSCTYQPEASALCCFLDEAWTPYPRWVFPLKLVTDSDAFSTGQRPRCPGEPNACLSPYLAPSWSPSLSSCRKFEIIVIITKRDTTMAKRQTVTSCFRSLANTQHGSASVTVAVTGSWKL